MSSDYKEQIKSYYAAAAVAPDPTLCCVDGTLRHFPEVQVPQAMLDMNYGCGSTVQPQDLAGALPLLYVGVGGGLEALQLAYFRRRRGGVIAVDPVREMREAAARNLEEAARTNPWFRPDFVELRDGSAQDLPAEVGSVDVVAQNCLFNVFTVGDLRTALSEVHRVLAPQGRFSTSDPVSSAEIPASLRANTTLRARCCSGCVTYDEYIARMEEAGFGRIVVRAKFPYRLLTPTEFPELDREILLESIEALAVKTPARAGRTDVFTGRYAVYRGTAPFVSVGAATFVMGMPAHVSDALAAELETRRDFLVTEPTYHARSPGCC